MASPPPLHGERGGCFTPPAQAGGMHGRFDRPGMKNRPFAARLGFAFAGLRLVFRREKSFRTQAAFAAAAALALVILRPGPLWTALVVLSRSSSPSSSPIPRSNICSTASIPPRRARSARPRTPPPAPSSSPASPRSRSAR